MIQPVDCFGINVVILTFRRLFARLCHHDEQALEPLYRIQSRHDCQTAPGQGIQLRVALTANFAAFTGGTEENTTTDVIVPYLKVGPGPGMRLLKTEFQLTVPDIEPTQTTFLGLL